MKFFMGILRKLLLMSSLMLSMSFAIADTDFCWKDSYGRGVGSIPVMCSSGEQNQADLCYPVCRDGYDSVGPVCWSRCPTGYIDTGAMCHINKALTDGGSWECTHWFPGWLGGKCRWKALRCPTDYTNVGAFCALTSAGKSPPPGMTGTFLDPMKDSYGRGAGTIPSTCPAGQQNDAGLCYTQCIAGFTGIGPVCWGQPPPSWQQCGMGAAKTSLVCGQTLFGQISSVGQMAITIASLGSSTSVIAALKAPESAGKLAQLRSQYTNMKAAFETAKNNNENLRKAILAADLANLGRKAYIPLGDEFNVLKDVNKITIEDLFRIAAEIAAIADTSGVSNTVAAYTYPKCRNIGNSAPIATEEDIVWSQLPGLATNIGVASNGTIWIANTSQNIFKWTGSSWLQVPGSATRISVDSSGNAWIVNAAGAIFSSATLGGVNTWISRPGQLVDVGVGANGAVWGVNASQNIYTWVGPNWKQLPGSATRVSVDPAGNAWVINANGQIYTWNGNDNWILRPGSAKSIAACGKVGDVYIVGTDGAPYKWNGSNWDKRGGSNLLNIACDGTGKVYATNNAQQIFSGFPR